MKTVYKKLPKAPIKEAVIDIQFQQPVPFEKLYNGPIGGFKDPTKIYQSEFNFREEEGRILHEDPSIIASGYRYDSEDGAFVVQVRLQGLAVSRLAPYNDWDDLCKKARETWELCFQNTRSHIGRLAVRYINALEVQVPPGDRILFRDYMQNAPLLPDGTQSHVENFFTRLVVKANEPEGAKANIIQTFEPLPDGNGISLILDVDVYLEMAGEAGGDLKIWDLLESLSNEKNRIFFSTMTDKALELCS